MEFQLPMDMCVCVFKLKMKHGSNNLKLHIVFDTFKKNAPIYTHTHPPAHAQTQAQ